MFAEFLSRASVGDWSTRVDVLSCRFIQDNDTSNVDDMVVVKWIQVFEGPHRCCYDKIAKPNFLPMTVAWSVSTEIKIENNTLKVLQMAKGR